MISFREVRNAHPMGLSGSWAPPAAIGAELGSYGYVGSKREREGRRRVAICLARASGTFGGSMPG